MPEEFYSVIVTYTFHDDKRKLFLELLKTVYPEADELDESTYGFNECDWKNAQVKIKKICDEVKAKHEHGDSVTLFCSGHFANIKGKDDKIRKLQIV